MIDLLLHVMIVVIVLGAIWYIASLLPLPAPFPQIVQVVIVVVALVLVIYLLFGLIGDDGGLRHPLLR